MSVPVEVPKAEESTPVTKPVETTSTLAEVTAHDTTKTFPTETGPMGTMEPEATPATTTAAATETSATEAVVEATPATEGVLAYKAPGLLK